MLLGEEFTDIEHFQSCFTGAAGFRANDADDSDSSEDASSSSDGGTRNDSD